MPHAHPVPGPSLPRQAFLLGAQTLSNCAARLPSAVPPAVPAWALEVLNSFLGGALPGDETAAGGLKELPFVVENRVYALEENEGNI